WVQVLHSFDLPRRRDLAFSVVASVALVAEAGSLSLDATFGLVLVPYAALVAVWLFLSDRARAREEAGPARLERRRAKPGRAGAGLRHVRRAHLDRPAGTPRGGDRPGVRPLHRDPARGHPRLAVPPAPVDQPDRGADVLRSPPSAQHRVRRLPPPGGVLSGRP